MPENLTPGRSETPGQFLRAWGNLHPTLSSLRGMLRPYPATEASKDAAPGLYLDSQRAPWVSVRGEIRVSLARLIAVTPDGRHQLLGQVQATANERDLDTTCTLRFYLHQPAGVIAREVQDETRWWLDVLDAHYGFGGAPLDHVADVKA